jgi:F-box protein 21
LVWRRHCEEGWWFWHERHDWRKKLRERPAETEWRQLYKERRRIDFETEKLFEALLNTQQHRLQRIETIANHGDDVRELLLVHQDETPDDAPDVLARRHFANAILGRMNRKVALEKWSRLQRQEMVSLEEVLGSFDLFAMSGKSARLHDIAKEFDYLAREIREEDPKFNDLSIRARAIRVAEYLRKKGLVGNSALETVDYHALRNNYISMALFVPPHTSLPLQTAAIYCAVARRLGVNAKPSNYPQHVHVVVEAPRGTTLDGKPKLPDSAGELEIMHLDPWNTNEEIPEQQLRQRLLLMGAPSHLLHQHLGAATTIEIVQRTARNIMNSVQEARRSEPQPGDNDDEHPEREAAWYSMLWALMVLGGANALQQRRHCLPYLQRHVQQYNPEDLGLIQDFVIPMFADKDLRDLEDLSRYIAAVRAADRNLPPPSPRDSDATRAVRYEVGTAFLHKRYGYAGIVIGWDAQCAAEQDWIRDMRVDSLPRGRTQPFYNVL